MIHHKLPLSKGGTDKHNNLVALCRKHHGFAHKLCNLPPETRKKLEKVKELFGTQDDLDTVFKAFAVACKFRNMYGHMLGDLLPTPRRTQLFILSHSMYREKSLKKKINNVLTLVLKAKDFENYNKKEFECIEKKMLQKTTVTIGNPKSFTQQYDLLELVNIINQFENYSFAGVSK